MVKSYKFITHINLEKLRARWRELIRYNLSESDVILLLTKAKINAKQWRVPIKEIIAINKTYGRAFNYKAHSNLYITKNELIKAEKIHGFKVKIETIEPDITAYLSIEEAEKKAGKRLDRRKKYCICGLELCTIEKFREACSGCSDHREYSTQGSGCKECGWHGVRVGTFACPIDAEVDNKTTLD